MPTAVTLQDQLAELRMMMLDHGDPAHLAAEAEFVAFVAEILRPAKADTHAMMLGTAEACDPLTRDSVPVSPLNKSSTAQV
jgi:hypothetical protein